jgi:thymidylate synthase
MRKQLERDPLPLPTLIIDSRLKTLEDFETATTEQFALSGYVHHAPIHHPFSV